MSARHTPGPWEVVFDAHRSRYSVRGSNGLVAGDMYCGGAVRFDPNRDWRQDASPFEAANASLIAAAPESYEANVEAADFLLATFGNVSDPDDPGGWNSEDAYSVYQKLTAAIAKARGQ